MDVCLNAKIVYQIYASLILVVTVASFTDLFQIHIVDVLLVIHEELFVGTLNLDTAVYFAFMHDYLAALVHCIVGAFV